MKKNRIAIIGTVGIPAKYGGFETLAEQLVTNLSDEFHFTVYCSKKRYSKEERITHYKGAKLEYINLEANGIQSILYDCVSIVKSLKNNDILLILGVAGAIILPFIKLFTNKKIIISIDGIEWKREKWSFLAKIYLWWAEKIAVKYSHFDISDNESIQDYTAIRYDTLSKVIEYGSDHTLQVKPNRKDYVKYTFLNGNYAVKVCRIEPENNIHVVLNAFSLHSNTNLVIIGNWGNNEYGKSLKKKYSEYKNIFLYDPIYDQREIDLIRGNATLYVHGHSAGGTNPSLVEAMFLGLPIVSYNVSYNKTTTENKALYFSNELELNKIIQNLTKNDLKILGLKMKRIADRRYKWEIIAEKYRQLFTGVLFAGKKTTLQNQFSIIKNDTLEKLNLSHLKYTNTFYDKR
jgi:glycosyltransferase involved in cell wall biosynthesis